jgi:hypothetical protein
MSDATKAKVRMASKATKCADCKRPRIEHIGWTGPCTTPGIRCERFVEATRKARAAT